MLKTKCVPLEVETNSSSFLRTVCSPQYLERPSPLNNLSVYPLCITFSRSCRMAMKALRNPQTTKSPLSPQAHTYTLSNPSSPASNPHLPPNPCHPSLVQTRAKPVISLPYKISSPTNSPIRARNLLRGLIPCCIPTLRGQR